MNLQSLFDSLLSDTLETSLPLFRPELVLCGTIVLMLLVRLFRGDEKAPFFPFGPFPLALIGSIVALWSACPFTASHGDGIASLAEVQPTELFTGMLVYDTLTVYIRIFLMAFLVLFVVLSRLTGIADRHEGQDYYTLVFGATLGMCIMASANHMITIFLGVEMASVPSYVLAGMVQGRRRSSEASLKYAVYGAGTAGVMLYGISLLSGVLGSAHMPTMAHRLAELDLPAMMASGEESLTLMVLALGGMMLGVGLAFKLSAVPFHFWCPDVFEGASAEVDAFLSVASKAAALALLLRVGLGLGHLHEDATSQVEAAKRQAAVVSTAPHNTTITQTVTPKKPVVHLLASSQQTAAAPSPPAPLSPVRNFFVMLVAVVSIVTCTFGNLAAYGQKNIKRMLAYSTIAHAGYMMMAVAAAIALVGPDVANARIAVQSLLLYASIYFFMNLGAFAIVAFLRNAMGSEEIKDYAGLMRCCPVTAVCMVAILISLVGLPPLAGFWGKLRIFQALFEAGGPLMMVMLVVAGLNTVISLVFYLRVAKTMCIDPEPDTRGPVSLGFLPVAYILLVSLPVFIFGILPDRLAAWAYQATAQLFS